MVTLTISEFVDGGRHGPRLQPHKCYRVDTEERYAATDTVDLLRILSSFLVRYNVWAWCPSLALGALHPLGGHVPVR